MLKRTISSDSSCAKVHGPVLAGLLAGMFLAVGASYLLRSVPYGHTVDA
ncbi:MAG: hypothetical protein M3Y57_13295 [Acidobacteriota bacterium]|nr:hypothetical protein [Acidobacteriota bacterium]